MVAETGIYITWVTGAIIVSLAFMPIFKPPYAKLTIDGLIDMFRRYWAHIILVFSVYVWKDIFDGLDRSIMANTRIDMTPYVYAIEGDVVLWIQEGFRSVLLDQFLTHFYVMGFMSVTFSSLIYPIYFDDRHMADRVCLSIFWVYIFALPFYILFNVRVTGDHIPAMETIAYDLTPEIHNWFTRIDPFTNGMPSLHIGLPFAVWLTLQKWDEDGRWRKFSNFILLFISVTAFTIIYLGIHWLLDIIGGMLIAMLAVKMSQKTHKSIWRIFDERRFSHRLARMLNNPRDSISSSIQLFKKLIEPYQEPGKKQTSLFIATLLISTSGILLWDATHQNLPLEGAEWPTSAAGSGEWLITIEELPDETIFVAAWNTTSLDNRTISTKPWATTPKVTTSDLGFALFTDDRIDYFEFDGEKGILQPLFRTYTEDIILDISIASDNDEVNIVILHDNSIKIVNKNGGTIPIPEALNSTAITSSNNMIAWSSNSTFGPIVNITSLDFLINTNIEINSKDFLSDQTLLSENIVLDYKNSTISELEMDGNWLVAVVDLGPIDRLILIDIFTGNQTILGDPLWQSSSPSISDDNIAFLQISSWNPALTLDGQPDNNDVWIYDIDTNLSTQLTFDQVNEQQPQVLKGSVAWLENRPSSSPVLIVHSLEEIFQPYSSVVIQAAILMLIPLIFVWSSQSIKENKT
ncbi:MAG: membrane-associated phospholipid phosphatase [Candidatus Thalassarchaeaceae archaeon]|jgi:membrane-associated phospholipid phosphatase